MKRPTLLYILVILFVVVVATAFALEIITLKEFFERLTHYRKEITINYKGNPALTFMEKNPAILAFEITLTVFASVYFIFMFRKFFEST